MYFPEQNDRKTATWADSLASIVLCLLIIAFISLADATTFRNSVAPNSIANSADRAEDARAFASRSPSGLVPAPLSRQSIRFYSGGLEFCNRIAHNAAPFRSCLHRHAAY